MSTHGSRPRTASAVAGLELFGATGWESANAVAGGMLKGWSTIAEAWIGLCQSQIDGNLQLMQALAKCDNPVTALNLQLDGARAAFSRCMSAASRTSDIANQVAAEALAPLQAAARPESRAA